MSLVGKSLANKVVDVWMKNEALGKFKVRRGPWVAVALYEGRNFSVLKGKNENEKKAKWVGINRKMRNE